MKKGVGMAGHGLYSLGSVSCHADEAIMRTELYEQYKKENQEELFEIGGLKAATNRIEERRKALRNAKLARIEKWKDILNREDETYGDDCSRRGDRGSDQDVSTDGLCGGASEDPNRKVPVGDGERPD